MCPTGAVCRDDRVQWNEIAQLWHAPAEALERDTYRVQRLCWTFQTPEAPKDVAFTVSLYTPTVVPAPDDPTLNETQPLRPAVHTAQFTATVGTTATVVSVDLDFGS